MKMTNKKQKKPWIRKRHAIVTLLAKAVLTPYVALKYGAKIEKFKDDGRQYLVLSNHQTGFDQFFVALAFKGPMYYIASEDIFSMGFTSDLIRFAVAPIPIKKQANDIGAMLNCMRVAREGGRIVVFPEGNRTYSGCTEYMSPSIAMLAKKLALPIAFFKIEGGYGVAPRWSAEARRGRVHCHVSRVLEPEEYKGMSNDELMELIKDELYVDDTQSGEQYYSERSAEYLERALYYCHRCGFSTFESHGDIIECKRCGMKARYLPDLTLEGVGNDLPYRNTVEWYRAQQSFLNSYPLDEHEGAIYRERVRIEEVIVYKNKEVLYEDAELTLYSDRLAAEGTDFSYHFDDIKFITPVGKNRLNLYIGDKVYQVNGGERFNAIKYVNIVFRYRNLKKVKKGEEDDKFLGL